jgi:RNA polymerase sigma-70 factor (ECF subfamily)
MDEPVSTPATGMGRGGVFPTTQWTTLLRPIQEHGEGAQAALERLCEIYRKPLIACAKHLLPDNPFEAEDIVHDYICALLRREDLAKLHRESGKFRSFLAAGIRNRVIDFIHTRRAQKRGGGAQVVSLEEMVIEPAHFSTAEVTLCRNWIQASITEVIRVMSEEWSSSGKSDEFNDLKDFALSKKTDVRRTELAAKYRVTVSAVDTKIFRFRRRFRELLRELIAQTVSRPEEVDEEIRFLMSASGN